MDGWMDNEINGAHMNEDTSTYRSCKFACEVGACLLSKAMRQVLLRPMRGGSYSGTWKVGGKELHTPRKNLLMNLTLAQPW